MICLRCGYCCKQLFVPIVKDPKKGIKDNNIITHLGNGIPCPHLIGDKVGKYSCAIHNYLWYVDTPCYAHSQIEKNSNCECRIGRYLTNKQKESR